MSAGMSAGMTPENYDVVIVGAGPAGSRLGYQLAKSGRSVLITDKIPFPRHRIGESLTGECAHMLSEMGLDAKLKAERFPIKRGVGVRGPTENSNFYVPVQGIDETGELVAGATWQVRRPEFDQMMLDAARAQGADYLLAEAREVLRDGDRTCGILLETSDGLSKQVNCRVLADASGYSTYLNRKGITGLKASGHYDKQIALFAQLEGVERNMVATPGDTMLFYGSPQNWAWSIPIDDNTTSIGIVCPVSVFKDSETSPEGFFTSKLKDMHPDLARSTAAARITTQVWRRSNYSYQVKDFAGPGFVCIGDAHRFLDPIFSFGVYLGMKEADLAAVAINQSLQDQTRESEAFAAFKDTSDRTQQIVQDIINTFWQFPLAFLKLAHFSHKNELAELFAGRFYSDEAQDLEIVGLMRNLLATKGL